MSQNSPEHWSDELLLVIIDSVLEDVTTWYGLHSELLEDVNPESHFRAHKAQHCGDICVREYETLVCEQIRRALPITERQSVGPEFHTTAGQPPQRKGS
jgi:hypothetical protein